MRCSGVVPDDRLDLNKVAINRLRVQRQSRYDYKYVMYDRMRGEMCRIGSLQASTFDRRCEGTDLTAGAFSHADDVCWARLRPLIDT